VLLYVQRARGVEKSAKGQELESMCLGMYPGNEQARSCTNTVVLSEQANIRPKQTLQYVRGELVERRTRSKELTVHDIKWLHANSAIDVSLYIIPNIHYWGEPERAPL